MTREEQEDIAKLEVERLIQLSSLITETAREILKPLELHLLDLEERRESSVK